MVLDHKGIAYEPILGRWLSRMRWLPAVLADIKRVRDAMAHVTDMKAEFEGPDGKVHWRDSRLEWPLRHGFFDFVAREFSRRQDNVSTRGELRIG